MAINIPVFQDKKVADQEGNQDAGTLAGWQQALDQLIQQQGTGAPQGAGAYNASQLFKDPDFVKQWNQQYPGSLPQVGQALGAQLNNYNAKGSSGYLTEAVPLMAAIAGGQFGGGEIGADAIPASSAGVGAEGGSAALGEGVGAVGSGAGVGSGGITEAASSLSNFATNGTLDANSAELLGMSNAAGSDAFNSTLASQAPATGATATNVAAPTLAETSTGISTSPGAALNAPQVANSGADFGGEGVGWSANTQGGAAPSGGAASTGGGGIISRGMDFARANPIPTLVGANLASGIIGGIGSNITANQIADKKIQAEKDALAQQTAEKEKLAGFNRGFTQSGSYYDAKLPFKAKPGALLRPNGQPVYPGIINRAIG